MTAADHTPSPATDGLREAIERASRVFGWQHLARYSGQSPEWLDRTLGAIVRDILAAHPAPPSETATEVHARSPLDPTRKSGHYVAEPEGPCWCRDVHYYEPTPPVSSVEETQP